MENMAIGERYSSTEVQSTEVHISPKSVKESVCGATAQALAWVSVMRWDKKAPGMPGL